MSMIETVQCIRCHAQMEDGYVPDSTEGDSCSKYGIRGNLSGAGGVSKE
jgi:hypothetical protein